MSHQLTWAVNVPPEHRPPILNERHKDWPWLFSWVPRAWTAWLGPPPVKLEGNADLHEFFYKWTGYYWKRAQPEEEGATQFFHPLAIPENGQWWKGDPDFYASKSTTGTYIRNGYRWDDVDGYYTNPSFTIKKY